jgi:hypothetical protein
LVAQDLLDRALTVVSTAVVAPAAITTAKALAVECLTFALAQRFLQLPVAVAVKVVGLVVPVVLVEV